VASLQTRKRPINGPVTAHRIFLGRMLDHQTREKALRDARASGTWSLMARPSVPKGQKTAHKTAMAVMRCHWSPCIAAGARESTCCGIAPRRKKGNPQGHHSPASLSDSKGRCPNVTKLLGPVAHQEWSSLGVAGVGARASVFSVGAVEGCLGLGVEALAEGCSEAAPKRRTGRKPM